ncbi:MAG: hypothetical protein FJX37_06895 [Alphaproteobacteria bacterium]|nr:hypothetical protein [Alphaproteobacteria bacterium]MBM3950935.1 hypothetical protein [Rhodospirillales bacterium]
MAIQNVLSTAVSGLFAQSARAAEIAHNVANLNSEGFKPVEVLTVSIQAGEEGAGVSARRREPDGQAFGDGEGGDTELAREFVKLIEIEIAYKANAQVLRAAETTLGRAIDLVA